MNDNFNNAAAAKKPEPGEFIRAAMKGDLEAMKDLIQRGADVNERDQFGGAALMWAMQVHNKDYAGTTNNGMNTKQADGKECVSLLLDNGAVIDKKLMDFAENNAPQVINILRNVAMNRAYHAAAVYKQTVLKNQARKSHFKQKLRRSL